MMYTLEIDGMTVQSRDFELLLGASRHYRTFYPDMIAVIRDEAGKVVANLTAQQEGGTLQ